MPASTGVVIEHPNRGTTASRATKATVIVLLLASAALVLIVTIGGWDAAAGAQSVSIAFAALYLVIAFYVARWNRGVLPVSAALAMMLAVFAAASAPGWFDRSAPGFTDAALSADVLGLMTAVLVPVQVLLIAFAMRGFQQRWNVEVHHRPHATRSAMPSH